MSKRSNTDGSEIGKISYVAFYFDDWRSGCATLPPMAEWAYYQICMAIWDTGKPIDADDLAMILIRAGVEAESLVELLIRKKKITRDRQGRITAKRAFAEHRRARDLHAKRSKGGKNSAKNRQKTNSKKDNENSDKPNSVGNTVGNNQNQNQNQTSPKGEDSPPNPQNGEHEIEGEQIDFLSGIPEESWEKFKDYRREIGKPLTKVAANRARILLERLQREEGMDPAAVIQQTIDRTWVGLFPLKDERNGKDAGWQFVHDQE